MNFRIYEMNDEIIGYCETKAEALAEAKKQRDAYAGKGADTWVEAQERTVMKDSYGGPLVMWREVKGAK